ncbi:nuclear pore complex protein Nup214 isoform X2 [Cephus cinctus]|uniref:Nuclear pore complex protein Nup214 isoform X2 n=1 Tax=Cephus cinctus TaxID=211228 RepID=A0AAJ7RLU1_CEPCN|nr:nuclear pore complex protein Nup214 isoform X2 [Cephus cinctus]
MKNPPDPQDIQDFQFKQSGVEQLCDAFTTIPTSCSLVAADGKRGLLYVAWSNKITILKPGIDGTERKLEHAFPNTISRITLNCDCSYLAVTFSQPAASIYNAASLVKNQLELLQEIRLSPSNENVFVFDIRWNPCIPGMLCTITSDHTIGSFQIKGDGKGGVGLSGLERIAGVEALCAAWSPKGKQLAVGCKNGNIVQLKPDLKIARTILSPSPSIGEIIAVLWISNYQFCAAYLDPNEQRINVLIVDAPKGAASGIFTCYDDITYGMPEAEGAESTPRYYFEHIPEWDIIIAASSSSSEIAILGTHDSGTTWVQWQLVDNGRAQLPFIKRRESYPVGLAVDKSSTVKLPWGTESTLPNPVPMLHIFGTSGQLCSFHMINLKPNCPAICKPPTEIITISEQPRPSIVPSEMSFSLNSGITSTPLPKQTGGNLERPKDAPVSNLFGSLPQVELKQPKPIVTIQQTKPVNVPTESIEPKPKPNELKATPLNEPDVQDTTAIDESLCLDAFREEKEHFEKELKTKLEPLVLETITDEERRILSERVALIDEFFRELQGATKSLASDVACLKALLLQSFAWAEETKSKNSTNMSDTIRHRGESSKLAELQRMMYYVQSQLIQATKFLDLEWTEQESHKREKMKIPSLEFIYQSLMRQTQIIAKEKTKIEVQTKKWKSLTRGSNVSDLNSSMSNLNLSLSTNVNGGAIDSRCKAIANKAFNFTEEKQRKLRNLFRESTPRVIKAVDPTPAQDRLKAILSSLARMAPVTTESKPKSKRTPSVERVTLAQPPIHAPTEVPENALTSLNNIVARISSSMGSPGLPAQDPYDLTKSLPKVSTSVLSTSNTAAFATPIGKSQNAPLHFTAKDNLPKAKDPVDVSFMDALSFNSTSLKEPVVTTPPHASQSSRTPVSSKPQTTGFPLFTVSSKTKPESTKEPVASASEGVFLKSNMSTPVSSKNTSSLSTLANVTSNAPATTGAFTTMNTLLFPGTSAPDVSAFGATIPSSVILSKSSTFVTTNTTPTIGPTLTTTSSTLAFTAASPGLGTSVFSGNTSSSTPAASIFSGGASSKLPFSKGTASPGVASVFAGVLGNAGSPTSKTSVITSAGAAPIAPAFGKVSSTGTSGFFTTPIFGKDATSPTAAPNTSLFGGATSMTESSPGSGNLFNKTVSTPASTTGTNVFGGTPSASSPTSIFSKPASPSSQSTGTVFGGSAVSTSTTAAGANIFGGTASATPTSSTGTNIFGSTAPVSTATNIFGGGTASSTSTNVFGKAPATTSTGNIFGGSIVPTSTPSAGTIVFGSPPALAATSSAATNVFGNAPALAVSQPSGIFGGTASTQASSSGTNMFGGAATSSLPSSGTNLFGGVLSSPPVCSTGTNAFGGAATTSSPGSIFNKAAAPAASASFGVSPQAASNTSIFSQVSPASSTTSMFGGASSNAASGITFGEKLPTSMPTFGSFDANQPKPTGSIFGGSGQSSPGMPVGSSMGAQAPAAAFGQAPAFGSKPIFGMSSPVGGSTFGTTTFGAPASTGFGNTLGASPMPAPFGSSTDNNTFGSLSAMTNKTSLTFDSLARKAPEEKQNLSFQGGSSFQSWR